MAKERSESTKRVHGWLADFPADRHRPSDIAAALGLTTKVVTSSLNSLKRAQEVTSGPGGWQIITPAEPEPQDNFEDVIVGYEDSLVEELKEHLDQLVSELGGSAVSLLRLENYLEMRESTARAIVAMLNLTQV